MSQYGAIYFSKQTPNTDPYFQNPRSYVHHSFFLSGTPVASAGEIVLDKMGFIVRCNAKSGHYLPSPEINQQFSERLKEIGYEGKVDCRER